MFHDLTKTKEFNLKPAKREADPITAWAGRKEFLQLNAHTGSAPFVKCLTFSPDSKHLATGGGDGLICIWDVTHYLKGPPPLIDGAKAGDPGGKKAREP